MNSINTISPYRHNGQWVFDDPQFGLVREAFVSGADSMIDRITADIPDAANGFVMLFSTIPFPGHQWRLEWIREGDGGNWYYAPQLEVEGWLCPSLFHYFDQTPEKIYVQVKPRS